MSTRTAGILAVGILAPFVSAASAAVAPDDACRDRKETTVGKSTLGLLKAFGANGKAPNPGRFAADVSKAQSKLTRGFTRAEFSGVGVDRGCDTVGDVGAMGGKIDAFVQDVVGDLVPPVICGDGIVVPEEGCDDGNTADGDCCSSSCVPAAAGTPCTADADPCTDDACDGTGLWAATPRCGNGTIDAACGEACDPPDDSACAGLCQIDCTCPTPVCGNGVVEEGEACDGTAGSTSCPLPSSGVGCTTDCFCCCVGFPCPCNIVGCCNPSDECVPVPGGGACVSPPPPPPCGNAGEPCGELPGGSSVDCCIPHACVLEDPADPMIGVCHPIACSSAADCAGTDGCQQGRCCAQDTDPCGSIDGGQALSCCGGGSCLPDPLDPSLLRCDAIPSCTSPSDCPVALACENGLCCAQPGQVCGQGDFDSGTLWQNLVCCGEASCAAFGGSLPDFDLLCCLDPGVPCSADADCCSSSCNPSTSICDCVGAGTLALSLTACCSAAYEPGSFYCAP